MKKQKKDVFVALDEIIKELGKQIEVTSGYIEFKRYRDGDKGITLLIFFNYGEVESNLCVNIYENFSIDHILAKAKIEVMKVVSKKETTFLTE